MTEIQSTVVPGEPHEIETIADEPTQSEIQPNLGDLFARRYRIERCIGRGSMGTVYAAHDRSVDEHVALKVLVATSPSALTRFRQEVRLARRVTHRNAARTFDLGEFSGAHFITMELVEGESVRIRLAQQPRLDPSVVVEVARQVCMGLQAAHDVGVVHRDLKPANVLIETTGRAVITDFGIALSTVTHGSNEPLKVSPMAGTPAYMSPEQVMGITVDGRSDLYALGVMLFEMLTGRTPWRGGNRTEVAVARIHQKPPDPRDYATVPDALAELVLRCMAQDPQRRPQSPTQLAEHLAAVLGGPPSSTPTLAREAVELISEYGTSSTGSAVIATSPGDRTLAVMPFRYRGPPTDDYLAEALSDELIDLLAMTRGLKVSASGATARFRGERDARTVGRALGVNAIVDGNVQRNGDQVRIVARLIDVNTGFQQWSERFNGRLEDLLELQDRMAKRVAEALRVELVLQGQRGTASAESIEAYLRGRTAARQADPSGVMYEEAIRLYDQAHAASPAFLLPLSAKADASVERFFVAEDTDGAYWFQTSLDAVKQALESAPGLAETYVASARLEVNRGDFITAAAQLDTALDIAPTYAAAHEYLGMLQCDTGRSREGTRHILLAHELDPTLNRGMFAVLRHYALRGASKHYENALNRARSNPHLAKFALDAFELRFALWHRDLERARSLPSVTGFTGPLANLSIALVKAADHSTSLADLTTLFDQIVEQTASPRLKATWRQLEVEVLAFRDATDAALQALSTIDDTTTLLDADWLESCPLLQPLHENPTFDALKRRVRQQADQIWHRGQFRDI